MIDLQQIKDWLLKEFYQREQEEKRFHQVLFDEFDIKTKGKEIILINTKD